MGAGVMKASSGGGTRRRRRATRRATPMSEINVTPFVDVMLVLLIIFMVAAPLLTAGVPVNLPQTAADPLPSEPEEPLTVTLLADGSVQIQTSPTARADLVPKLRAIAAERDSDRIYLRADGSVNYAAVMEVMGALSAGGFANIGLVTEPGGPTLDGQGQ